MAKKLWLEHYVAARDRVSTRRLAMASGCCVQHLKRASGCSWHMPRNMAVGTRSAMATANDMETLQAFDALCSSRRRANRLADGH